MRLSEAKEVIKELYKNSDFVTALISERGVGKTSAYKQCCSELGIGYIDLYATALEGPDFMGLPAKDVSGGYTRYLPPEFLPTVEAVKSGLHPKNGILVIEEINRVSVDTVSVLYPLLLDRRINGHNLAPGWKLGVTMNPDNMNYMVNPLDDAIIDRFISINIDVNLEDYISYSNENNPNNKVLAYLKAYPDMLLVVKDNSSQYKSPTPRGWSRVQKILNNCSFNKDILTEVVSGIVGSEAAASFFGFLGSYRLDIPLVDQLLKDYNSVSLSIKSLVKEKRFDSLTNLISLIIAKLKKEDHTIKQLDLFLNDIPKEFQIIFFKEFALKKEELFEEIADSLEAFEKISDTVMDLMASKL